MRPTLRTVAAAAAVVAVVFAAGCSPSVDAARTTLQADLRSFATDPAGTDLAHYQVDGQLNAGQIVMTVTTLEGPCWTATVTWPYTWLLDGTGRGQPSEPVSCRDQATADHGAQPERSL
jgi:hypothetical protein